MDAPLPSSVPSSAPYHPSLSAADRQRLAKHPHCLDLPLSAEQLEFLHREGYLVLKKLIPASLCEKIVNESFIRVRDTLKVTRKDPGSWHGLPPHGIVNIWHLPALYELRQHPLIYSLFAQLMKTHKLCVSLDRVSMKAPSKNPDRSANDDLPLHTDTNYWFSDPNCPTFQGGLCLEDCPAGGGGFFCLPEEHQSARVDAYKAAVERGDLDCVIPGKATLFCPYANAQLAAKKKLEVVLERGDFVVWNNHLPHAGGRNTLRQWRLHCYVRCLALEGPVTSDEDAVWAQKYQTQYVLPAMKTGAPPKYYATGGSAPGNCNDAPYHTPPALTALGRKLFGIEEWED